MIAFDTNVLVRFLIDDDPAQADQAQALMQQHTVFLSSTVLLETEWVLRSRYQINAHALHGLFLALLNTDNVLIEHPEQLMQALAWYKLGADFADALHLAACGEAEMHTFDQKFCRQARMNGLTPPVTLL